jgi:hypothetical protein
MISDPTMTDSLIQLRYCAVGTVTTTHVIILLAVIAAGVGLRLWLRRGRW